MAPAGFVVELAAVLVASAKLMLVVVVVLISSKDSEVFALVEVVAEVPVVFVLKHEKTG